MRDDIIWKEPPPKYGGGDRVSWASVMEKLKQHPGAWALAREYKNSQTSHSTATNLRARHGHLGFEFEARGREVYARYREGGDG